jgi:hypothetical protein
MAARIPQQLPNMLAPTFDVEEIDKRISDLRAVEHWLDLNATMLRTTIQTLEVQRATITTLKGFGGAVLSPGSSVRSFTTAAEAPPEVALGIAAMRDQEQAAIRRRKRAARKRAKAAATQPTTVSDAPLNPAAWWNTLQDQFTKIANAAAAPGEEQPAAKPARKAARARRAAKRQKAVEA